MKELSPLQAIREFCRVCNGENKGGKKYDCLGKDCTLYPWKRGKGIYELPDHTPETHKEFIANLKEPVRKGRTISEEQKKVFSDRMKKAWETRKKNNI